MTLGRNFLRLAGGVVLGLATLFVVASAQAQTAPLPSWNDTVPKAAIVAFVEKVTKENSPDFAPEPERIAVFDNDATLCRASDVHPTRLRTRPREGRGSFPSRMDGHAAVHALPQRTISLRRNPD